MTSPTIAVVVLSGGRPEKLVRCLEALARGTRVPDMVVVVDNDASGETAALLDEVGDLLPITRVKGHGGFAESRNRGIEAVATDLVAFLDDDCYAHPEWLETLASALSDHDAVGGLVLPARDLKPPQDFLPELNWTVGLSPPGLAVERSGR